MEYLLLQQRKYWAGSAACVPLPSSTEFALVSQRIILTVYEIIHGVNFKRVNCWYPLFIHDGSAVLRFAQKYFIICALSLLALLLVFASLVARISFSLLLIRELRALVTGIFCIFICGNFSLISSVFFIHPNVSFDLNGVLSSRIVMWKLLTGGLRHQEVNRN